MAKAIKKTEAQIDKELSERIVNVADYKNIIVFGEHNNDNDMLLVQKTEEREKMSELLVRSFKHIIKQGGRGNVKTFKDCAELSLMLFDNE